MFKQQVQDTSGFFKKQQQALAEKVQKGFNMTSSIMSGQKKDASSKTPEQRNDFAPPDRRSHTSATGAGGLNPAWISALGQMGFEESQVEEAAVMLGGKPDQMDDLLQVLVSMNESITTGGAAADKPVATPSVAPVESVRSTTTLPPPLATTTLPQPPLPPPLSPAHSPALASMSAVGSEEFEMAVDKHKLTHSAPKFTQHKTLTPSAFLSLQQMGFTPEAIRQATTMMGPSSSYEELFDLLLTMGSPLSPPNSGTATSSTDGACAAARTDSVKPSLAAAATETEVADLAAAALVAEMVEEELGSLAQDVESDVPLQSELVQDVEPDSPPPSNVFIIEEVEPKATPEADSSVSYDDDKLELSEPSTREIAASVVALVISKVAAKSAFEHDSAQAAKHVSEGPFTASPVRGGA
jgi:Holliday junction resolvasome RuvABC DNA-binding subunit